MAGIFISYRREDSAGFAGHLVEDLKQAFEPQQIFRDIEAIEAGTDFVDAINRAVSSSSVILVMIGPHWLTATGKSGQRRLDEENDFVRLEVQAGLSSNARVIPVLVGGASMPAENDLPPSIRALARRQAHEITERRWDYDVEQLFATLERVPGVAKRKKAAPAVSTTAPAKGGMSWMTKAVIGVLAVAGAGAILGSLGGKQEEPNLARPNAESASISPAPVAPPAAAPAAPAASAKVRTADAAPDRLMMNAAAPRASAKAGAAGTSADRPMVDTTEKVAAIEKALQPETPPPPSAIDVTGTWHTQDGEVLQLEQRGQQLGVIALDDSGTQAFMGGGSVKGHHVDLNMVHLQSGIRLAISATLAPDGRTMKGTARESLAGTTEQLTLTRQ
ncbi:MAG TPA: toll/interleukin-1 receptor domain-containing protein [Burkholderiales bacterium]|nr:toll/interleukin-1 receptor domain-containing protein [Burkholderiales bacterium]